MRPAETIGRNTLYSNSPTTWEKPKRSYDRKDRKPRSPRTEYDDATIYSASSGEYTTRYDYPYSPRSRSYGGAASVASDSLTEGGTSKGKEKGRWIDILMALVCIVLGAARFASAFLSSDLPTFGEDSTGPDAFEAVAGSVFIAVGLFVAAPEFTRFTPLKCIWATRSAMFDRGIWFVSGGAANIAVEFSPSGTKLPSIALGGTLIVTGLTYIVLSAKHYNRFHKVQNVPLPLSAPPAYPRGEMILQSRAMQASGYYYR